jgi:GLPGLI family protein
MKKLATLSVLALLVNAAWAQQTEGTVIYERTTTLHIMLDGMNPSMQNTLPKSRAEKLELDFAANQSIWKAAPKEIEDEPLQDEGGIQIRFAGNDDVIYCNFNEGTTVEKRDLMDKTFIVDDSLRKMKWKITGETKTVLGHTCSKAITSRYEKRMQASLSNGTVEQKEVNDTATVVAWFAMDIPVSAGPGEYQGQLPGLILEMDIHDGKQTYKAISISDKTDVAAIKPPKGKKHYSREEFKKEQKKISDQMQGGGNTRIRIMQQ